MRFDTPVYFQRVHQGEYDPDTGNYGQDIVEETKRYASVTDTGSETVKLLYGDLRQGVQTIRLQNHYKEPFDRIRIGDKIYRADSVMNLRVKQVFTVSEVQ